MFAFEIIHQSKKSAARVGRIHTPHGVIDTPNFVPVATNATLKCVDSFALEQMDIPLIFCNTYHLMLQPGTSVIKKLGGLHGIMNRTKPIITDSGGFQVFSLAYGSVAQELKSQGTKSHKSGVLKIEEEGVWFRSYRDGQKVHLTPESSVMAQKELGADIIIPLDELPPFHIGAEKLFESFHRTHRWQARSLATHLKNPNNQAMYGVVHGGVDEALRKDSATILGKMDFNGFAIGGSLGRNEHDLHNVLQYTVPFLEPSRPRHLLGIGDVNNMDQGIVHGIDTFDSSYPTRAARHGMLLTGDQPIKINQKKYSEDSSPISKSCECTTCQRFSRAYLHHLFKAKEPVYHTLSSVHNLFWMAERMSRIREEILGNKR